MNLFCDTHEEGEGYLGPSDTSNSYESRVILDGKERVSEDFLNNNYLLGLTKERWDGRRSSRYDSAEEMLVPERGRQKWTDDKGTGHEGYVATRARSNELSLPECEDRSREEVDELLVHRAAMSNVLETVQHTIGLPLVSVVDLQRNVVYLKTASGMFASAKPRILSFFDWIMNLHHSMGLAQKEKLQETHSIVDDTLLHQVLGFEQYVLGPPRIRSVIGHPIFAACPSYDDICAEKSFVGFIFAMDRVSYASHRADLGSITSFARVIGGILGPGGESWENIRQVSSRTERLQVAFLHASIPLMIVNKEDNDQVLVEVYNDAMASLFRKHGSIGTLLDPARQKNLRTVALSKHHEESLSMEESTAAALCLELISVSSFGLDASKCGQYHMVYSPTQPTRPIPQDVLDKGTLDVQSIYTMRHTCRFSCKYEGKYASLETFKCVSGTAPAIECVSSIMSLKHDNILRKIRSGSQLDSEGTIKEVWILQETASLGTLHDLVFSGGIPSGCLKSLVVALSALDIARGIQQVHNAGLVYSDLSTKNVYVQKESNDALRGWRLVLGIPNVFDNLYLLDTDDRDLYTFSNGRVLSSCPERCLGGMPSIQTDLYSFGIILWEMWEAFSAWPQMYEEKQLVDTFCFEKNSMSRYRHAMPEPMSTIFSMCILQDGEDSTTNENIITMLEDYVCSAKIWTRKSSS